MERAFRINPGSDLWNRYWAEQEEKKKFFELSEAFRNKYELTDRFEQMQHYRTPNLRVCLNKVTYEKYKSQIKVAQNSDFSYEFKVKSTMNQAWRDEVWSNLNTKAINATRHWVFNIEHGMHIRFRLFHLDGETLLAWIESDRVGDLPDSVGIKLSEYHAMIEAHNEHTKEASPNA